MASETEQIPEQESQDEQAKLYDAILETHTTVKGFDEKFSSLESRIEALEKSLAPKEESQEEELDKAKKQEEEPAKPKEEEEEEKKKKKADEDKIAELETKIAELEKTEVKKEEEVTTQVDPVAPATGSFDEHTKTMGNTNFLAEAIDRSNKVIGQEELYLQDQLNVGKADFLRAKADQLEAMAQARQEGLPPIKTDAPPVVKPRRDY